MKFKNLFRITILSGLTVFFLYSIIFNRMGVNGYLQMKREIEREKNKILKIETEIKELDENIQSWNSSDFELEKMARQDLQMGYPGEHVYLLPGKEKV